MIANYEKRNYKDGEKIWAGRYHNLNNLPHWHLECELIFVEKGTITVSHNHQNYDLVENDAIFLESGEVHYIKSEEESIVSILMFDPSLIRELTRQNHLVCARLTYHYPIPAAFAAIRQELEEKRAFFEIQSREYLITLMVQIFRSENLSDCQSDRQTTSIDRYKELLMEIDKKYNSITFRDAAAFMGLTEPYFSRFFRKISGMTFSRYLNIIRVEHAIELLKQNNKKTETAYLCGFETIRHFNRVFKEITGISPSQMPRDYVLKSHPVRLADAFDPTLQGSELL